MLHKKDPLKCLTCKSKCRFKSFHLSHSMRCLLPAIPLSLHVPLLNCCSRETMRQWGVPCALVCYCLMGQIYQLLGSLSSSEASQEAAGPSLDQVEAKHAPESHLRGHSFVHAYVRISRGKAWGFSHSTKINRLKTQGGGYDLGSSISGIPMGIYSTLPFQQILAQSYNNIHLIWPVHLSEMALPLLKQESFLLGLANQTSRNFSSHHGQVAGTLLQLGALWFMSHTEWCSLTCCQTL